MPSKAYHEWRTIRRAELDRIEHVHTAVGTTGRGRWYAPQQVNQAYVVLLASHFQGYCRDLYAECADFVVGLVNPTSSQPIVEAEFKRNRQLERGNAQPGIMGADFGRLVELFWDQIKLHDPHNHYQFQRKLGELNDCRNAIAHQDFSEFGGSAKLRLAQIRRWRVVCNRLARVFDTVLRDHLQSLTGTSPWEREEPCVPQPKRSRSSASVIGSPIDTS